MPAIKKARDKGVMVIALDSPTDPVDGTDALFATDNYKAGVLIGQYAKAALGGKPAKIVTLDLFPGHPVGAQRHNGFLQGLWPAAPDAKSNELGKDAAVVCMADSYGDQRQGPDGDGKLPAEGTRRERGLHHQRTRRCRCLQRAEEGRQGEERDHRVGGRRLRRHQGRGRRCHRRHQPAVPAEDGIHGRGCGRGIRQDRQEGGGYTDTGVTLIAAKAVAGVDSKDVKTGTDCAGANRPQRRRG
jgi:fructose transport system substrate-binding protein